MKFPLFTTEASQIATQTDYLYWGLISISVVVLLVVFTPMILFIFKYRRGKPADRRPRHLPEIKIELTWTLIPLLLMMGLYVWGANQYFTIERPPANAMEINVVGKQRMWKIQHPEG